MRSASLVALEMLMLVQLVMVMVQTAAMLLQMQRIAGHHDRGRHGSRRHRNVIGHRLSIRGGRAAVRLVCGVVGTIIATAVDAVPGVTCARRMLLVDSPSTVGHRFLAVGCYRDQRMQVADFRGSRPQTDGQSLAGGERHGQRRCVVQRTDD